MSRRGFGHAACKAVGKAADDPQWRKSRRRLSQTQRSELPSGESGLLSLRPEGESRQLCMGIVTQIEDLDNSSTSTPGSVDFPTLLGFLFLAKVPFFRFATERVAAGRQGTSLAGGKDHFREFPQISGFFRFENVHFENCLTTDPVEPGFSRRES